MSSRVTRFCRRPLLIIAGIGAMSMAAQSASDEVTVAVAANFAPTLRDLAPLFEQQSGHKLTLVVGSSAKHYAQIRRGAPFAAFFAADAVHPARLERDGLALPGSRATYALGRLVLWSADPERVDTQGQVLMAGQFAHLALANPRFAPYGQAAQEVLTNLNLWQPLQPKLVRGENVAQTFQFVQSGAADLGFVALSQWQSPQQTPTGSHWLVPAALHAPIEQQAVALARDEAVQALMAFMQTPEARALIRSYGYEIPRAHSRNDKSRKDKSRRGMPLGDEQP